MLRYLREYLDIAPAERAPYLEDVMAALPAEEPPSPAPGVDQQVEYPSVGPWPDEWMADPPVAAMSDAGLADQPMVASTTPGLMIGLRILRQEPGLKPRRPARGLVR